VGRALATVNILLVDDEPRNLIALESVLQDEGRNLVCATSGQEALKYALKEDFAVILLDVLMPGMDGFELASLIRGRERSRDTPIIFLTAAQKSESYVFKGYALGAVDYIFKPFDPGILRSKVAVFVELFRKTHEVKRQAEQLAETTAFLNSILESSTDYAITAVDLEGVFQFWSEGAHRLYGYSADEMVGRERIATLHTEEDVANGRLERFMEQAFHEGKAEGIFERVRKNGERFSVSLVLARRTNSQGAPVGYMSIAQDITDRLRAEEERARFIAEQAAHAESQAAKERFAFLAEASTVLASSLESGVALQRVADLSVPRLADICLIHLVDEETDALHRVATAHAPPPEHKLQAEPDTGARSDGPGSILHGVVSSEASALLADVAEARYLDLATDSEDLRLLRTFAPTSGMVVPIKLHDRTFGTITLLSAGSGRRYDQLELAFAEELGRRAALAVDNARLYEAQRSAREAAEAAVKARDEFLSIASHELRTPVTGIKVATQLMLRTQQRGPVDEERQRAQLTRIEGATSRLATLVEDLLDVSRLQTGRLKLRTEPCDLHALAEEVIEHVPAGERHRLLVEDGPGPWTVLADPARIDQVLTNLVSNAVKYSPEGGEISVALEREGDGVLLRVRDAGIGVPADAIDKLFHPFGRAPNAEERQIPGLGLGLYICRQLVERHGGRIWAESGGHGKGMTVSVWLPEKGPIEEAPDADGVDVEGEVVCAHGG
jgi:PAS domain S-box-containing protein